METNCFTVVHHHLQLQVTNVPSSGSVLLPPTSTHTLCQAVFSTVRNSSKQMISIDWHSTFCTEVHLLHSFILCKVSQSHLIRSTGYLQAFVNSCRCCCNQQPLSVCTAQGCISICNNLVVLSAGGSVLVVCRRYCYLDNTTAKVVLSLIDSAEPGNTQQHLFVSCQCTALHHLHHHHHHQHHQQQQLCALLLLLLFLWGQITSVQSASKCAQHCLLDVNGGCQQGHFIFNSKWTDKPMPSYYFINSSTQLSTHHQLIDG